MRIKQVKNTRLPWGQMYKAGELTILKAVEGGMLHVSMSHPKRNPTWEEIREIREKLTPDEKTMAIILPPKSQYVNIHNFCFHLWEIPNDHSPRS